MISYCCSVAQNTLPNSTILQVAKSHIAIRNCWPQRQWELHQMSPKLNFALLPLYVFTRSPTDLFLFYCQKSMVSFPQLLFVHFLIGTNCKNWKGCLFASLCPGSVNGLECCSDLQPCNCSRGNVCFPTAASDFCHCIKQKKKKRKPLSTTADSEEQYDLILEKTNRNPKLNKLSPRAFLALSSFKPFCLVLVPFSKANSFKVSSTKLRNSIKIGQLYNFCCIKWWFLRLPWDKYAMLKRAGEKSPKCLSGKPLQQCFVQMD